MVPFTIVIKATWLVESCQGVHQDWFVWCIQFSVYSRMWQMENNIMNMLWSFQVCCYAFWSYICTYCLSTLDEWCFLWVDLMVCYIDGIFIFSNNIEEHEWHVWLVLDKLQEVGLYALLKEYEFHQIKVEFIGYILDMVFTWTFIRFKPLWIKPPNFCLWYSMFSYICQLLTMFYYALFHVSGPSYSSSFTVGVHQKII